MATTTKKPVISHVDFHRVKSSLSKELMDRLEEEIEMKEFDCPVEEEDLWNANTLLVDSKEVIKLSPILEKITGQKIKPEWIQAGGYESVEDAIKDVLTNAEKDLIELKGVNDE